tara:strand:+ start:723 stop:1283 length:561 start_codon:yes stop_codon:yes gene_type:complete
VLIGITGKKGAGKDTLAQPLIEQNFANIKMAGPLKDMLRTLYYTTGMDQQTIERKIEGDLKETPCKILQGQTPRYAMQKLGDEWRNMIGENLWTDMWRNRVARVLKEGIPVVCTDIRYKHEAQVIKDLGGVLVRVQRDGLDTSDTHISETEMDQIKVDCTISNTGDIEDLHRFSNILLEGAVNGRV